MKSFLNRIAPTVWERFVLISVFAVFSIRLILSARLGLGDDEAYYWDWSRHLSLSYFDHPAMVAWLIKIGTVLCGQTPLGVRLPNLFCSVIATFFLFRLAIELFASSWVAWSAIFLYLFSPIFVLGGLLMVPDVSMAAAWMGFSLALWRIYKQPNMRLWSVAGIAMGIGLISKYTMVLLALSAVVFLLFDSQGRARLRSRGFLLAVSIAVIAALPIIIWNARYDWPSLKFHLQERQAGGGGANFNRLGQYFITQMIALGPALYIACFVTLVMAFRKMKDARWRFVALVSTPPLLIFTAQALFAEFKPHWPAPAYPVLFIGFAEIWREGFGFNSNLQIYRLRMVIGALILVFLIPINFVFHLATVEPILPGIAQMLAPQIKWDPKLDPTNDLYGWDAVGTEVHRLQVAAESRGEAPPFLSSSRYQLTAQLAFATGQNVFRVSPGRDHYMFIQTPEIMRQLKGQNSLFVVDQRFDRDPNTDAVFESCVELSPLIYRRGEVIAHEFHFWNCRGFKGLP